MVLVPSAEWNNEALGGELKLAVCELRVLVIMISVCICRASTQHAACRATARPTKTRAEGEFVSRQLDGVGPVDLLRSLPVSHGCWLRCLSRHSAA